MHEFPPSINWRYSTLLATTLGYLICGDFTAHEQIALGNWIVQIGQTVLTNATYQQLIESRIIGDERINLNSRCFKSGGTPFTSPPPPPSDFKHFYDTFKAHISDEELLDLQAAIQKINEELSRIRDDLKKDQ